jgi:hypothetical protein
MKTESLDTSRIIHCHSNRKLTSLKQQPKKQQQTHTKQGEVAEKEFVKNPWGWMWKAHVVGLP